MFFSKRKRPVNDNFLIDAASVEPLEARLMLAGNVKVTVKPSGDILIKGDGADNYVEVSLSDTNLDGVADEMTVQGQASPDGSPTMIKVGRDTMASYTVDLDSADGKFSLRMGGGKDFVRLTDVNWDGNLDYGPGGGGDSLYGSNVDIAGTTKLNTGGGNDATFFSNTVFRGELVAKTGGGTDWLALTDVFTVDSGINYNTGGGADMVTFENTTVNGDVLIKTGGFPDEIYLASGTTFNGAFEANLGSFADALKVENGVNFNDLANSEIDASRPGPNFENALFIETGVNLGALPDVDSFGLQFTADAGTTLTEEFENRLANPVDGDGVNLAYLDSLRTGLHRRGFEFSEMALETTAMTEAYMQSLETIIVAGFDSDVSLERQLYNALFKEDYA